MVKEPDPEEEAMQRLKWEIAGELGLAEKVRKYGWGGLSAAETGRIGGLMTRRLREEGWDFGGDSRDLR